MCVGLWGRGEGGEGVKVQLEEAGTCNGYIRQSTVSVAFVV